MKRKEPGEIPFVPPAQKPQSASDSTGLVEKWKGGFLAGLAGLGGLGRPSGGLSEYGAASEGQLDHEARSLAGVGRDPDPAFHAANELPADVKTEPRSAHAAREVRVEPVELREDPFMLGGRDPDF